MAKIVERSNLDSLVTKDRAPVGSTSVSGPPPDGSGSHPGSTSLNDLTDADDVKAIEALTGTGYLKRTGSNTWALSTSVPWSDITSTPTTLAGYGIVDAQPLDADLTAIAALTGTNTLYYRSAANTWTAVTIGSGITFSGGTLSASGGGGSGNVVGPGGGATDNALARFDTTTGLLIQNSLAILSDAGALQLSAYGTGFGKFDSSGNLTSAGIAFSDLSSPPSTLAGYGITDGQPLDGDLTAIAALTGTGYLQRTGTNTWALGAPTAAPAGSDTQIQYNGSGTTAASADLTWDNSSKILLVTGVAHIGGLVPSGDSRVLNVAGANAGIQLRRTGSASPLIELVSVANLSDPEDSTAISHWDFYINSNSASLDDFTLRRRTLLANENIWRASSGVLKILPSTSTSTPSDGALVVVGGVGIGGNVRIAGSLIVDTGIIRTLPPSGSASTNWQLGDYSGTATIPTGRIKVRLDGVDYYIPAVPA